MIPFLAHFWLANSFDVRKAPVLSHRCPACDSGRKRRWPSTSSKLPPPRNSMTKCNSCEALHFGISQSVVPLNSLELWPKTLGLCLTWDFGGPQPWSKLVAQADFDVFNSTEFCDFWSNEFLEPFWVSPSNTSSSCESVNSNLIWSASINHELNQKCIMSVVHCSLVQGLGGNLKGNLEINELKKLRKISFPQPRRIKGDQTLWIKYSQ